MSGAVRSLKKAVSGILGGGDVDMPPMPKIPGIPTIDEAAKAREAEDIMRRRKGRAATMLTGKGGAGAPSTAVKTLLGE